MNSSLRRRLFLISVAGMLSCSGEQARAADKEEVALPEFGIETVLNKESVTENDPGIASYLAAGEKGEYLDIAFTNVSADTFLYVRSEPSIESEWVGKLYPGSASEMIGPVGEWTKVRSGTVTGYVFSDYIMTGTAAQDRAEELAESAGVDDAREAVTWAESKEEEAERLEKEAKEAEEEAKKLAEEHAANVSSLGQTIVDYACQFIGNPYVWGGTSLTSGADCSGFVQSVYANFGISLPRTTWDQENAGIGISYEEAMPGDLILYEGHVGIYMGNGEIVNAINPSKGIGIIPATCMSIKTVRRVL